MPEMISLAIHTTCCIVGGGPAGMMLGLLLARAGIDVNVLEKHSDFLRDFRGDTIHPSTLELLHELGLLEEFLKLPHQEAREIHGVVGGQEITIADFTHLPSRCKFIALIPQWHFLNFIAQNAKKYPSFHLRMQTQAIDLVEEEGIIMGVKANAPEGVLEFRADLTVGADGRHSTLRKKAKLKVVDRGAPIDVLWMKLSRKPQDPGQLLGRINHGKMLVMLDRNDYWQCAYVIHKGGYDAIREKGLEMFREAIVEAAPFLQDRVKELTAWDEIKHLAVSVDYLESWHKPGLLCIGDSAHAMSPVGGVGINLAIQDAVAAANILVKPLKEKSLTERDLQKVQERRAWPAMMTQRMQIFLHNNLLAPAISNSQKSSVPWILQLLGYIPFLRRIPARLVGLGFRPEHIRIE